MVSSWCLPGDDGDDHGDGCGDGDGITRTMKIAITTILITRTAMIVMLTMSIVGTKKILMTIFTRDTPQHQRDAMTKSNRRLLPDRIPTKATMAPTVASLAAVKTLVTLPRKRALRNLTTMRI